MSERHDHPGHAVVIQEYRAQYTDPIVMRLGDVVTLGERDAEYPWWLWCTHPDGRSGWVHESFLSIEGSVGRALCDYSAKELTAIAGEVIELHEERGGWVRATKARGESGWLPADHVRVEPGSSDGADF